MNLSGKNILITGGGNFGVGSGMCKALSQYGARLLINEPTMEQLESVLKQYPDAIPAVADISKADEVKSMFDFLKKEVGTVHGLVNNAGIGLSKPVYEVTEEEFDRLYGVDVRGLWLVSKYFVRQLLENKMSGNIVNVSSIHAHSTMERYAIYASAKSAVEGLTRGMAIDLGKYNIRVNAIAPGYVHAEQNYALIGSLTSDSKAWIKQYIEEEQVIPRAIQPEECGYVAAFLLSDLSSSVTGQTIHTDNGSKIKLLGAMPK